MTLPVELKSSKKRLINIKNNDQKCFLWCFVRHINPVKIHPERITREDKKNFLIILITMTLGFLCEKKILERFRQKMAFALLCFVMKISCFFRSTFEIKKLKARWICCLQLMKISHIMCISKILTDENTFTKQRIKTKNTFVSVVYSALVVKMYWKNMKKFAWALMMHNL